MSNPYPDARSWARDHSLANVPRLARLEGFAFQAHPEIVATFGADGAAMVRFAIEHERRRKPAHRAKNLVIGVLGVVMLLAPIAGVAVYGAWFIKGAYFADPLEAQVAVPVAGVCFMIAALTQVVLWVVWLRGGAHWSPFLLGMAVLAAVFAAFAAIGVPNSAARDDYDASGWLWPVWVTLVLGVALAIGILVRRGVREAEPEAEPEPASPNLSDRERARMLVDRLPDAELRAVRDDRDDALRILAERALLDEATLQRALAADLGTLFTLDPIRAE
jgi:hypothetical protein